MHLNYSNKYLVIHLNQSKLMAMILNTNSLNLEEKIIFDIGENVYIDFNFIHK